MNTHEHQERPVAHAHAHTEEELVASSALHAHKKGDAKHTPVSYTHLTLPTIYSV